MKKSSKTRALIMASILVLLSSTAWAAEPLDNSATLVMPETHHPVNINEASAPQIAAALKGVGLKTAAAIVAYRRANGPFKTADSLMSVKGVGRQTLLKNTGVISLE